MADRNFPVEGIKVTADKLWLGDIVRISDNAFADAIVSKIADDFVTFFRPYGRSDDFVYGDPPQVICLMGAEHFSAMKSSPALWHVIRRNNTPVK